MTGLGVVGGQRRTARDGRRQSIQGIEAKMVGTILADRVRD